MATATQTIHPTTSLPQPSHTQINRTAEEIRRDWTPAERRHRQELALVAQRRLFCLAFDLAA